MNDSKKIKLLVSFTLDIMRHTSNRDYYFKGPLFHKFSPNGKNDCLENNLISINGVIKLWFERRFKIRESEVGKKII